MTSANAHATDFGSNYYPDERTRKFVLMNAPTEANFDVANALTRDLLWAVLHRINERLGLGYSDAIKGHKVTNKTLELEAWHAETEGASVPTLRNS
jgi:hypothetical protein